MEKVNFTPQKFLGTYIPTFGDLSGRVVRNIVDGMPLRQVAMSISYLWKLVKIYFHAASVAGTEWAFPGYFMRQRVANWRTENPEILPQVPADGICVGLPNLGNTCWFNASLVDLSAHVGYDSLFTPTGDEDQDQLRQNISDLIIYLRTSQNRHTLNSRTLQSYLDSIVEVMIKKTGFAYEYGEESDVSEFLLKLIEYLDGSGIETPIVCEYNSSCDKLDTAHSPFLFIDIPEEIKENGEKIDLETGTHFISPIDGGGIHVSYPTKLPDEMICVIKRFDQAITKKCVNNTTEKETKKGKEKSDALVYETTFRKHANPIEIKDGIVRIPLFPPEFGRMDIKGIQDLYQYKVTGSIIHIGKTIESGHYIATEITESGNHLKHNDEMISEITECEEANAYILHLERLTDD